MRDYEVVEIDINDFEEDKVFSMVVGIEKTYDIEVDDNHHYILGNGIVSHNTLTEIVEAGGGGIEPIFDKYYTRRERATTGDWKEWDVYSHVVRRAMDKENLPYIRQNADKVTKGEHWVTAHNVNNMDKIDLLSEIQNYVDSAISVTYNLPETAVPQEVKDIYFYGWKKGLKGIAVYREGSKQGVLITDGNNQPVKPLQNAEKRPRTLPCDIIEMQVDKRRVIALVGLHHDRPYEVFITDDPDDIISVKHAKEGFIEKVETGRYDLTIEGKRGKYILEDISSVFDNEWGTLGRMVSMSLRHNVPLQFIVDQLSKTHHFNTFSKGMARVLKKYINDGEKVLTSDTCPVCGEKLVFLEGCKACRSCGWSKCD